MCVFMYLLWLYQGKEAQGETLSLVAVMAMTADAVMAVSHFD